MNEQPNEKGAAVGRSDLQGVVRLRCPDTGRYGSDLIGCGSANVAGPDDEGLYDCCDCGLFFRADAA